MKKLMLISVFQFLFCGILLAQTVYVTKSGTKYHESNCSYLSKSSISIELKEALDKGYSSCSRCNPPLEVKTGVTTKKKSTTESNFVSPRNEDNVKKRCKAITKKGTQCKRNAEPNSDYCWQHKR